MTQTPQPPGGGDGPDDPSGSADDVADDTAGGGVSGGDDRGLSKLWAAVRKAPERGRTPNEMVADLFGTTRRGTPNTRAAADELGVSQRTVQRWLKQGRLPARSRTDAAERLQRAHNRWKNTPTGRQAAISPRREARLRRQGTTMRFLGTVTISSDKRRRSTTVQVTGDQMGRILDASLSGNDAAAHRELEDAFGQAFGGSVSLSIDELDTWR